MKRLRHHSDDGARKAIERDGFSQDVRIAVELRLPQAVHEDHDAFIARSIFLRGKSTPELWPHTEHRKDTGGGAQYADLERMAARAQWDILRLHHRRGLKTAAMLL